MICKRCGKIIVGMTSIEEEVYGLCEECLEDLITDGY